MDKLLRHRGSQLQAMGLANERQHHVHRGRSARAANALIAPFEELIGDFDGGIALLKRQLRFPMQSHPVALQKTRLG